MQHLLNVLKYNFSYTFDSRTTKENCVFIALETGLRSGSDFALDAIKNGAVGVISQKEIDGIKTITLEEFSNGDASNDCNFFDDTIPNDTILEEKFNLVVKDSLKFMQELARVKFKKILLSGIQTIAVTGSVGKSTSKEFIANTLSIYGKTYANYGNYNNHIGMPLTILNTSLSVDYLVLEMGMNNPDEIKFLTEIAPCKYRIITNVKENHSGNFHNGETGVLHAKFEILENMDDDSTLFIDSSLFERFAKDDNLQKKYRNRQINVITYKSDISYFDNHTIFSFFEHTHEVDGIYSESQVQMLILCLAVIKRTLGDFNPKHIVLPVMQGRGDVIKWNGVNVVNESYNASLSSMKNAIENFVIFSKPNAKNLYILGDMRELGKESERYHTELLDFIKPYLENSTLFLVGESFSKLKNVSNNQRNFIDYQELKNFILQNEIKGYDNILVKASNGTLLWKLFDEVFVEK